MLASATPDAGGPSFARQVSHGPEKGRIGIIFAGRYGGEWILCKSGFQTAFSYQRNILASSSGPLVFLSMVQKIG